VKRRRIAVFTSSRADLGPLGPVIEALDTEPNARLTVIATGTHSAEAFGGRLADIRVSGRSNIEMVDAEISGTDPASLTEAYGRIAAGISRVLASNPVDVIVVLGDRWELLAAVSAALLHGVPIAHLHGGETTEGAIDERIRHAITKLADLHLCATVDSARRIRHLGEEPWRIVVTGAPGLDRIGEGDPLPEAELEELLGSPVIRPFGVVVYHPPTVDRAQVAERARAALDAAAAALGTVLVLYPGADPGSRDVIDEIERATVRHSNVVAARNLGDRYLRVLRAADVLVGNSSSGIIEASSLGLPVVDVGDRQRGRVRPPNVLNVGEGEQDVRDGIARALSPEFRVSMDGMANPYGDGTSARRIVRALLEAPLDRLVQKPLMRVPEEGPQLDSMIVPAAASLRDAVEAIDRGGNAIALVADADRRLLGTIVDGDVRRALLAGAALDSPIGEHVTVIPVVSSQSDGPEEVLTLMQRAGVTQVPVVDADGRLVGLHVMRAILGDLWDVPSIRVGSDS
jgi:UDP-N-acetylglucosamine 2-epimerase (non-hydrolysing)